MLKYVCCFVVVAVVSTNSCTRWCADRASTNSSASSGQTEDTSNGTYLWMDYIHRDMPLQYWVRILGSGDAWYVRYDNMNRIDREGISYPRVMESRSGKLPSKETESLFELINEKGFLRMEENQSGQVEVLSEDDIVVVEVRRQNSTRTVRARPPSHISSQLSTIVESIRRKVDGLEEDGKSGVFLRAELVDGARRRSLGDTLQFILLSEHELKEHPYLMQAVQNPSQFVHGASWEQSGVESYVSKYNFFYVSTERWVWQISVYLREKS